MSKRIGPLATPQLPCLLCLSFTFLLLKPKTPKYLPFSVCNLFLIQSHLSIPSAPRGIDILIYRKATSDPLDLWVIKNRLLAQLTGKATQFVFPSVLSGVDRYIDTIPTYQGISIAFPRYIAMQHPPSHDLIFMSYMLLA